MSRDGLSVAGEGVVYLTIASERIAQVDPDGDALGPQGAGGLERADLLVDSAGLDLNANLGAVSETETLARIEEHVRYRLTGLMREYRID